MNSITSKKIVITPIGRILLQASDTHINSVELLINRVHSEYQLTGSAIIEDAVKQLSSYFRDPQHQWSLPLTEQGTLFQRKVWRYLQTIPQGETRTYSDVADELGTSARAVGNACRANPYAIVIPCHRVVSRSGIGGYYGKSEGNEINVKQWLLDHECRK